MADPELKDSEAYQRHANKRNHPDLKQPTYPLPLVEFSDCIEQKPPPGAGTRLSLFQSVIIFSSLPFPPI